MTASCYLCAIGNKTIPDTDAGDAVGVCKLCHVLACQGHAIRDANYPRWICALCDLTLLTVAAVLQSGDEGAQPDALSEVSEEVIRAARSIRSARQYFRNRPRKSWDWLQRAADEFRGLPASALDGELSRLWRDMSDDGQEMIRCALAIADKLEVRDADLIGILRGVRAGTARRV
ncbi:MAG TPA: hypothetical protein VN744_12180 [Casimicrobiaceae bacterium]|jgi:hypothetical protein|nr:hypothetical protein [Casimicrobiaceae bacterium]